MTHAKPIYKVLTALYLNDVYFGEVRIPFIVGKMNNKRILRRILHLSSRILSGFKIL